MPNRILLVEDEAALRLTLGDRLRSEGYAVEYAVDGEEGFEKATREAFDLIILDVILPKRGGFSVCRDLRQFGLGTPVMMLTARAQTVDTVAGLNSGADDYVTKPFNSQELIARIAALLRRPPIRATSSSQIYRFGSVSVDLRATDVTRDGRLVQLSAREFQLLRFFLEHPGVPLSREELLRQVWGFDATRFSRTVDVHVASLRQKLEGEPQEPRMFLTVRGVGYRFNP
jgi:two-component system, OmpR family, alkaline phosphatase synthesis response regulator PhoP